MPEAQNPATVGTTGPFVRAEQVAWDAPEHGVVAREAGELVDVFAPARESFASHL